jgi:uncharacterized protein YqcC (DUF446 family)
MDPAIQLKSLLVDIEYELRALGLWEDESPSVEALASIEPFAVDTLSFSQWLQFIFLPNMYFIIEQKITLPTNCQIAPMAEESFAQSNTLALIQHLRKLDLLLTRQASLE